MLVSGIFFPPYLFFPCVVAVEFSRHKYTRVPQPNRVQTTDLTSYNDYNKPQLSKGIRVLFSFIIIYRFTAKKTTSLPSTEHFPDISIWLAFGYFS